jgi:hypothetical protein
MRLQQANERSTVALKLSRCTEPLNWAFRLSSYCVLLLCLYNIICEQLDYVAKARSGNSNSGLALNRESVLTQLLSQMDGFSSEDGIVVMATTNRAVRVLTTSLVPYNIHIATTAVATTSSLAIMTAHVQQHYHQQQPCDCVLQLYRASNLPTLLACALRDVHCTNAATTSHYCRTNSTLQCCVQADLACRYSLKHQIVKEKNSCLHSISSQWNLHHQRYD